MPDILEPYYHLQPEKTIDDQPYLLIGGDQIRSLAEKLANHDGDVRLEYVGAGYFDAYAMRDGLPTGGPYRLPPV